LRSRAFYYFVLLLAIANSCFAGSDDPINSLMHRIAPAYENQLLFETIPLDSGKDVFEMEALNGKIVIRGNDFNSMAVGLNYYLKYYCHASVSWYKNDKIDLPPIMPGIPQKIRKVARVKNRFFLNYCTFGYTMPWWKWNDWERLIDWMALNGINMPLSITGEEAIWYKVWKKFGLNDNEIRSYFTGPAYLPWHRMSNIDHWEGPLPILWLNNQLELQQKIVLRERDLNMIPVLPAFAGHVPVAIKTRYPDAKITGLGSWGGFSKKYQSNFLDPFDPLFKKIQKTFLEEQIKAYGTNHVYGADPFNEVTPPSWEPEYLANVSKTIYSSITTVDSSAIWLQMSWLFYIDRSKWTNERIKSFITAVPQNKMMLLDYYCENTEVWKLTNSFYNQPYLWCYLGNFGGNTMLAGNLEEVEKRMEKAFNKGGKNLAGIGSTLEGFDTNPLMYEYVFEKAWSVGPVNVSQWLNEWAQRRFGKNDEHVKQAWQILLKTTYTEPAKLGQSTLTNSTPSLKGSGSWTTNAHINYSNINLLKAWGQLLKVNGNSNEIYNYDVTNVGRQVLGNYFNILRDKFADSYDQKDIPAMKNERKQMLGLLDDIDKLLSTQSSFLLGKWLDDARHLGTTKQEQNYYEKDARSLITIWGGEDRSLNDYANRAWGGLTKNYYKKRWQLFLDAVIFSVNKNEPLDEKAFKVKLNTFEDNWVLQHVQFTNKPIGNSIAISQELYSKYASAIIKNN
jgi:alpha-N-acetylglucosaminidase